jgi:hypothetical protein
MSADCPIAYDHTDDLDECKVCGWGTAEPIPPSSGPKDYASLRTGPERIREAIKRLSGGYAPTQPTMFNCRPTDPPKDSQ